MDNLSLGQRVALAFENFMADHSMAFVIVFALMIAAANFYYRFLYVNLRTEHIDLMKVYTDLQMRRRYKK